MRVRGARDHVLDLERPRARPAGAVEGVRGRQPVGLPPAVVVVVRKVRHHRPGSARRLGPAGSLQRGQPPHVVPRPVELPGRRGQRVALPPQRPPRDPSLVHSLLHHVGRRRPPCRLWVKASGTDDKSHLSVTLAVPGSAAERGAPDLLHLEGGKVRDSMPVELLSSAILVIRNIATFFFSLRRKYTVTSSFILRRALFCVRQVFNTRQPKTLRRA